MLKKLLAIFCSALVGYIYGWILGWSLFDPIRDLWALGAFVGAILGLVLALALGARFWGAAGILFGSAIGLFLGWMLRTLLFGEAPGGWGVLVILGGAILGGALGARPAFRQEGRPLWALTGALLAGFFGGLLVDVIVLGLLAYPQAQPSIVWRAPGVILWGLVGAWLGRRLGSG